MVFSVELDQLKGSTRPIPAEIGLDKLKILVVRVTCHFVHSRMHKHAGRMHGTLDAMSLPLLFGKMVELVQPVLSFCFFDHAVAG